MNFLASLFGGGKTTEKIVDGVVNGADALFFTDEEKSQANQKILDFKLEWVKATQGQNIARRLIAVIVAALWAFLVLCVVVAQAFGFASFSQFCADLLRDVVNNPFLMILGFYFLAHIARANK